METVFLVKPSIEYQAEYLDFYEEWKTSGELIVPWVVSKDPSDFEGMLQFLLESENQEALSENWVPSSTFWLVTASKRVVGAVNIRHSLNEKLFNCGGHIGYGIRPAERRKGYATKLLSMALEKTKELGIGKILVVCDESNIASEKTILKNGGMPDTSFTEGNGNVVKRFWITN
ncbi:GNAT family N-acetyltransferase [Paenibacillus sp. GCM10027626]|uniref:GNAT family N-acetyltransferase n=1 Tax=Paenibacillus sp. GCM10027626 TaxID=3273411 RepID=UPI00363D6475